MDKNIIYFCKKVLSTNPFITVRVIFFRLKLFYKWFLAYYVVKDFGVIERTSWYKDKGDINYKYFLNENSIVFNIGTYQGDFANSINQKFGSFVYLFETN